MKQLIVYKTFDNKTFDDVRSATIHLNSLYSIQIRTLASHLAKESNPIQTEIYIDEQLKAFETLILIKQDMEILGDNTL